MPATEAGRKSTYDEGTLAATGGLAHGMRRGCSCSFHVAPASLPRKLLHEEVVPMVVVVEVV